MPCITLTYNIKHCSIVYCKVLFIIHSQCTCFSFSSLNFSRDGLREKSNYLLNYKELELFRDSYEFLETSSTTFVYAKFHEELSVFSKIN